MKSVNVAKFMKQILPKGKEYIVSAYASEELNIFGKVIVISKAVSEITMISHHGRFVGYVLPERDTVKEAIEEYKDTIKSYIGVDAPYIGVFDMNRKLIIGEVRM